VIEISPELNEYRLNGVIAFLAGGAENAQAQVYSGARPALGETPMGTLLASIVLMEPLGTLVDGLLAITPTNEVMIVNTGQATWARVVNGNGSVAWDCDVSDLNGVGELRLPSTTLYAGGYTRIVSGLLG
jgi:hypothetical protein